MLLNRCEVGIDVDEETAQGHTRFPNQKPVFFTFVSNDATEVADSRDTARSLMSGYRQRVPVCVPADH